MNIDKKKKTRPVCENHTIPLNDQNGHSIYDQTGQKKLTIPFGAANIYIARHIREYFSGLAASPSSGSDEFIREVSMEE